MPLESAVTRRDGGRIASAARFPARRAGGGDSAVECARGPAKGGHYGVNPL
jgi:hypothetical protein